MIRFMFLLSMVACVYGCRQRDIPEEFERDILGMPSRMGEGDYEQSFNYLFERIDAYADLRVRYTCYKLIWDTISGIRIGSENGKQASLLIQGGEYSLNCANYHLYKNGLSRAKAVANIVEPFRWMKSQGDRLRPTHRIDYYGLGDEERRRYDEWFGAYLSCRYHFKTQLWLFEWHFTEKRVWFAGANLPPDELSEVRSQMEEFLGRPLRTLEQLRAMRNVDSEEIKAVKRKEVGPAWFARPSDPPISFAPLEILPWKLSR